MLEEASASLDVHQVYTKLIAKIGSLNVNHALKYVHLNVNFTHKCISTLQYGGLTVVDAHKYCIIFLKMSFAQYNKITNFPCVNDLLGCACLEQCMSACVLL